MSSTIPTKTCTICNLTKPISQFNRSNRATGERKSRGGHGVSAWCKFCTAERRQPGIHTRRESGEKSASELAAIGQKLCTVCRSPKPFSDFTIRRASPDGLSYKCLACRTYYLIAWRNKNPTAHKVWYAKNREKRSQQYRQWRSANRERVKRSIATWAKNNKHKVNALNAKRTSAKLKATPKWANFKAIEAIYAEAAYLTEITGIRHEVDHIYPLQGKLCCGLHCEANLQILTKTENIRKRNRMPEDYAVILSSRLSSEAAKPLSATGSGGS